MWHFLYQLALVAAALVAGPVLLIRRRRHYAASLAQRFGRGGEPDPAKKSRLWIHAVSVGEVGVAATLLPHLPENLPLLISTVTPTGQQRARERFPKAQLAYLPFDIGYLVGRFFDRYDPRLLILAEGDLWPTVLRYAKRRNVPVVVINGRISDRSYKRLRKVRALLGPLLDPISRFAMQTDVDRRRLLELGVPAARIVVTGNLKFESPEPHLAAELEHMLLEAAAGRPILLAGSTMRGEEEMVLDAYSALRGEHDALLVLAPRHPERWEQVRELVQDSGFAWARRSADQRHGEPFEVLLLDSLGELAGLYRLATGAFIGGTLVPTGGHNPLEAARFGVPVVVGPSLENFAEIAAVFDAAEAWARVASARELASCWKDWLATPGDARDLGRKGEALVSSHRGALDRTLAVLEPWIQRFEAKA